MSEEKSDKNAEPEATRGGDGKDTDTSTAGEKSALYGLLAEYETPGALKRAAAQVRDAGYRNWDTYTPFPVHGIEPAMGIRWTILPWIVFGGGVAGCVTGIWLQWWTNAKDYAWIVSGKPFWSLPANIPIIFELTVLFAALTAFASVLILNRLPHPASPLDFHERFSRRATDDRFFLVIEAEDPKFDETETDALLEGTDPVAVDEVPNRGVGPEDLPRWLVYSLIVFVCASMIPFAAIAYARVSRSRDTRIHPIPDMDWQMKFKSQRPDPFFPDGRAMRHEVEGTVAVGELRGDDHFFRGKVGGEWARVFPPRVPITPKTMDRGQNRYGIYCSPCHGFAGNGDGVVSARALDLGEGTWVPPTNFHQVAIQNRTVGELFNTITNGIRNMPAYGHLIDPADRWAIVLYVRALQRSQRTTPADVQNPSALR